MINYVPFLKSKINEIIALAELDKDLTPKIAPFFDYPRRGEGETPDEIKSSTTKLAKSFDKHLDSLDEIYFDIYDIDDAIDIDGENVYKHILKSLSEFSIIPVISIDRSAAHIASVFDLKTDGVISTDTVAIRLTPEDYQNYNAVSDDISEDLGYVIDKFKQIDLVLDCRVCTNFDTNKAVSEIINFSRRFCSDYKVRRVIVSGSSIPASVADVLEANSERHLDRKELNIFKALISECDDIDFIFGDYATVSPNYSDANIPPEQMQNRTTAKIIYSYDDYHYFIRGGSLKTKGADQYFDLAETLCSKVFFRGPPYSFGDKYFEEKSRRIGSKCYPNTVVKPSVNSHITYMVRNPIPK